MGIVSFKIVILMVALAFAIVAANPTLGRFFELITKRYIMRQLMKVQNVSWHFKLL